MSAALLFNLRPYRAGWGAGSGYLAGEDPGLVTVAGAPAAREIEIRIRKTRKIMATGFSASDGTWRFDGLDPAVEFDVMARDYAEVYNDVIRARVRPVAYE